MLEIERFRASTNTAVSQKRRFILYTNRQSFHAHGHGTSEHENSDIEKSVEGEGRGWGKKKAATKLAGKLRLTGSFFLPLPPFFPFFSSPSKVKSEVKFPPPLSLSLSLSFQAHF
jgi:hypothetical protein